MPVQSFLLAKTIRKHSHIPLAKAHGN